MVNAMGIYEREFMLNGNFSIMISSFQIYYYIYLFVIIFNQT